MSGKNNGDGDIILFAKALYYQFGSDMHRSFPIPLWLGVGDILMLWNINTTGKTVNQKWLNEYINQTMDFLEFSVMHNKRGYRVDLKKLCAGLGLKEPKSTEIKTETVTRELDPAHLTMEEQADLVEAQMSLRGNCTKMQGAMLKLRGLMMRPNALLNAAKINEAYDEIHALLSEGRAQLQRIA
jgi:hypothetical protein